jgi:hypothetical protein
MSSDYCCGHNFNCGKLHLLLSSFTVQSLSDWYLWLYNGRSFRRLPTSNTQNLYFLIFSLFETFMAPQYAPLAQSESKARFFERLGLDQRNESHRRLYAMIKVSFTPDDRQLS